MNKDIIASIKNELLFIKGQQKILRTDNQRRDSVNQFAIRKFTGRSIDSVDYILEQLLPKLEQACNDEQ